MDELTRHTIVVPEGPAPATAHAARELQHWLREMTGAELPVVSEAAAAQPREILIGRVRGRTDFIADSEIAELGTDGYVLRTAGQRLLIAGGEPRGTLYGVYAFLHGLGCRWFGPQLSRIPRCARLAVGPLNERYVPPFGYRNFIPGAPVDGDWAARNHVNGFSAPVEARHGGKLTHWQFGHSFEALVPPGQYYDAHPEYFALVRGHRLRDDTQLCCTNEAVIRLVTDNLRRQIEADLRQAQADPAQVAPDIYYLAQNDWGNCCSCPACRALTEREGAPSAGILHLCNRVVAALADEFPAKSLMTIAYRFSRRPPKALRPDPRLIVQLCSIECCQSHPLATGTCRESADFRRDLEGWEALGTRLWVWDYLANLWHPFGPGPGLQVLGPNFRYLAQHGVCGYFLQDNAGRDFQGLRHYLFARLLWDPEADQEALTREYLDAEFGAAAEPLRQYLQLVQDRVDQDRVHVCYKGPLCPAYLTPEVLRRAAVCWNEAQAAVASDPALRERVADERRHVQFGALESNFRQALWTGWRLDAGHYVTTVPDATRQEAGDLAAWAEAHGGALDVYSPAVYRELAAREDLMLDNGGLRLVVLPRLGGRLADLVLLPEGRRLFHAQPAGAAFLAQLGYRERWLGAAGPGDDNSFIWQQTANETGKTFEVNGFYEFPVQFERWLRLPLGTPTLSIETLLANRGGRDCESAIETVWPFALGLLAKVRVQTLVPGGTGRQLPLASGAPLVLGADDLGDGLLLVAGDGLGIRFAARGEGLERVTVQVADDAVEVRVQTKPNVLVPGGGIRLYQTIEVLRKVT